jgi:nicotinic acid phosphoribosyltransferase
MVAINQKYSNTMPHTFGPGTNLTDDFGLDNLSIVVKVTKANGHHVCKLSDNLDKATGHPEAIERAKRLCGYHVTHRETPVY